MLWAGPATFFHFEHEITFSFFGARIGQISMLLWFSSVYGKLLIALNRLVAITWPLEYCNIFSNRRLPLIIGFIWFLALLHGLVYTTEDCAFVFDALEFIWTYKETTCGAIASRYLDFMHGSGTFALVLLINTVTFFFIRRRAKEFQTKKVASLSKETYKKNVRLYIQGCMASGTLVFLNVSYNCVTLVTTTRLGVFAATTLVWEIAHIVDGVILVIFNPQLRGDRPPPSKNTTVVRRGSITTVKRASISVVNARTG
ncbi:hypothetical protein Y032_0001g456 [Ancylostoma ceylanicum]|nr:hypothetical protein Y032_0001g456 [Ancylostoma ceylanicum]